VSEGPPAETLQPPGGGAGVAQRLADLAARMRARGARPGSGELIAAQRALAAVDPAAPREARFALRTTLCSSRADVEAFDAAFADWLGAATPIGGTGWPEEPPLELPRVLGMPGGEEQTGDADPESLARPAAWSDAELLHDKDFAEYTDAERRLARTLMRRIASRGPRRASRRTRASRRRSRRPDARATLRASLRYGGEPFERRWRRRRDRPRPMVLIVDVSGSMEPYSRMLLQYAQACVTAHRKCEAFAFGTRLTRITSDLRGRDPDAAVDRAAAAVADWSGGTRIGAALAEVNRVHGARVGRGAVVVILSDGWDRGDPDQMRAEIARLGRCAHQLLWLNPLTANPAYEPLTRGMVAALPHLDALLAGNTLGSLAELADLVEAGATRALRAPR